MLAAMIDGETTRSPSPNWRRAGCGRKIGDLAQALNGTFEAHHAQLARSMLRRLDLVE
jgi:transposase